MHYIRDVTGNSPETKDTTATLWILAYSVYVLPYGLIYPVLLL